MFEELLVIVGIVTALTTLTTQAIKNTLVDSKLTYSSNALAAIVAVILSIAIIVLYYIYSGTAFGTQTIVECIVTAFFSWLASMSNYDKLVQLLKQLAAKN